ncbi:MAG: enoyl-CoA hydratase/isomerase family protein [Planctomycetes bacterium]|nr:enoyl-CoA hydratase/isomerase family protein [Planctomycetota bacterium]
MIDVKLTGATGTIVLQRPQRCNALTREMILQLGQALGDLHQEKRVRGIVLTGAGAHFCAGMDLKQWQEQASSSQAQQHWFADAQALQELLEQMLRLPKPIVAAVDGAAMGSGLAVVLACDLVVASPRATFSAASSRLGLVSGLVAPLAHFRCGAALASSLLIGGSELSAEQAKSQGLVHHLAEPEMIWVRASGWIESIAGGAAESLQLTKRVINEMVGEPLISQLAAGAAALASSLTTEAASEGLDAFSNKRPPRFPK